MNQAQKEAEKYTVDQQLPLNSAPLTPRPQNSRVQLNRRKRSNDGMSEEERITVGISVHSGHHRTEGCHGVDHAGVMWRLQHL
jgi:hypothetical protein